MLVTKHLQLIRLQQVQQLVLQQLVLVLVQVEEFGQLVLQQPVLVLVQVEEFAQLELLEQEHLVLLILLHQ
jgi:hypothetical protein